ncbi:MAG: N-acetyltransferase [Bauldia sp.]
MIAVRPETVEDQAAIRTVVAAAFGREAEADLVDRLRQGGDLVLSLIAVDSAEVVGHIAFSRLWIEVEGAPFAAVCLAPLSVRPDRQRQGIGARLIVDGHRRLAQSAERLSVLVGHPDYYPRFGYRRALAAGFATPWQGEALLACAFADAPTTGTLRFAGAFQGMD